jgi:hypothetical protein
MKGQCSERAIILRTPPEHGNPRAQTFSGGQRQDWEIGINSEVPIAHALLAAQLLGAEDLLILVLCARVTPAG